MTGQLYIDGTNAFEEYGVAVCKGGYDRIVEFPKPKKYKTTDWHESDGIEIDQSNLFFENRTIPINFYCKGDEGNYKQFISLLSDGVYHTFGFESISLTCNLRYVSCSNYTQGKSFCTFTLNFAFDSDVFEYYTYVDPDVSNYGDHDNFFNFGHFRQFGLYILGNYKNELFKTTEAKKALSISEDYGNGVVYDEDDIVKFSQRKSRLSFLMKSESWSDLWERWKALLYNFAYPGKKHLMTLGDMPNVMFTVWYDEMKVEQLAYNDNGVFIKFSVVFYTEYDESEDVITALCCENGDIFSTEDGNLIVIE